MEILAIKIADRIEHTIFEVFAALALGTAYNDFDTTKQELVRDNCTLN